MKLMFNFSDLNDLLRNFYTLTKIRIVIFDDEFNELASYPTRHSTYCKLVREDPLAEAKCIACDHAACIHCKKTMQLYTYKCHAGLTETVVPIKSDNIIIGYIMFGQILMTSDKDSLWLEISEALNAYNLNMEALYNAFKGKKNTSPQIIEAAASIVEISASYLHYSRKLVIGSDTLAHKIESYITSHIQDDLSASSICTEFNISKSKLYKISNHCFGVGIASHVRHIRIHMSKALLKDTDHTVYQVAELVGIQDYNYFTKVFKMHTGLLPTSFRKEN